MNTQTPIRPDQRRTINPRWRTLVTLVILSSLISFPARAQHLHIQTSFSPGAGWDLFWFDFDAGAYPAEAYSPTLSSPMRRAIPARAGFTNTLGQAGHPVWILPEAATATAPSIGFGTQGSGLSGGQIRLRLASYSGPGDFLAYGLGPLGDIKTHAATRDGLGPDDSITLSFPAGHTHLNLAFNRPGLYQLGWRAEGTLADTGQPTHSALVVFTFLVNPPTAPRLRLERTHATPDAFVLTIDSEPDLPVRIDTSIDATRWTPLTNLWTVASTATLVLSHAPGALFLRASHPIP